MNRRDEIIACIRVNHKLRKSLLRQANDLLDELHMRRSVIKVTAPGSLAKKKLNHDQYVTKMTLDHVHALIRLNKEQRNIFNRWLSLHDSGLAG